MLSHPLPVCVSEDVKGPADGENVSGEKTLHVGLGAWRHREVFQAFSHSLAHWRIRGVAGLADDIYESSYMLRQWVARALKEDVV
jgi:uncharacterized protein (DUF2384 family)